MLIGRNHHMKKIGILLTAICLAVACNAKPKEADTTSTQSVPHKKVLVAYFSRTGEQYGVGNIQEGNTAIVAKMIAQKTGGDLFEIKLKQDTYPTQYRPLTQVAKKEKKSNARPEVSAVVPNFEEYDFVFLGCPNWWGDLPMVMYSFMEQYNWSGKHIAPFVTHEGSGLSSIDKSIANTTKAAVLSGLSIYGHEAQNDRENTSLKVASWLTKLGF